MLNNKTIFLTDGTVSFGQAFAKHVFKKYKINKSLIIKITKFLGQTLLVLKKNMTNILINKLFKSKNKTNLNLAQNRHKSYLDALPNKVYELLLNKKYKNL